MGSLVGIGGCENVPRAGIIKIGGIHLRRSGDVACKLRDGVGGPDREGRQHQSDQDPEGRPLDLPGGFQKFQIHLILTIQLIVSE